jgi:hypothetical protein
MIDTTISISGVSIHEPMTVLTDLLIAALAITFYFQLKNKRDVITRNWSYFFLFLGLSTFLGACSHAFFAVHDGWHYKSFWLPMQAVNGIAVYCAQQATFSSALESSTNKIKWKWSYVIQLVVFIVVLFRVQKYIVTIIENAIGLIPIMVLHYQYKRSFAKVIAHGIAISFITAFVNLSKLSLHAYFNYNDIAHVFIMISLYVMYKGVRLRTISAEETTV